MQVDSEEKSSGTNSMEEQNKKKKQWKVENKQLQLLLREVVKWK